MTGNLIGYGERIVASSVLALLFVGPPVLVVWSVITGWGKEPLLTVRTATYTISEPAGLLVEAAVLVIWLLLVGLVIIGIRGGFPRGVR